MKFLLILWICSFSGQGGGCLPPMESKELFNTWSECSIAAHERSIVALRELGPAYVNRHQIGTKYTCVVRQPSI
mgnify:CR=1 FL=1